MSKAHGQQRPVAGQQGAGVMDERDAAMIRRSEAFERDKYTLRDPKSEVGAARWLLAAEQGSWRGRRVEYALPAREPYQIGGPDPSDPLMCLTLHVRERDAQLVIASGWVLAGLAIWREGITTREAPDLLVYMHERALAVDELASQIGHWIAEARAKQVSEARRSAAERHG
jgi:hypothetical protein